MENSLIISPLHVVYEDLRENIFISQMKSAHRDRNTERIRGGPRCDRWTNS